MTKQGILQGRTIIVTRKCMGGGGVILYKAKK